MDKTDKIELIKICIRKAIDSGDISFLDRLIDMVSLESLLYENDFIESLYKYCNSNYDKVRYLASIAYLKGKKEAKILLDLIESNSIFEDKVDENRLLSFLIRNSDDIFIMAFTVLKYFKYLINSGDLNPDVKVMNLLNKSLEIYPNIQNLKILKIYIMYGVLNYEFSEETFDFLTSDFSEDVKQMIRDIIS